MLTGVQGPSIGVIDGKLYVASGCCADFNSPPFPRFDILQVYDPTANSWTTRTHIPVALYAAPSGITSIGERLYVAGGAADQAHGNNISTLQIYDATADAWTTGMSLPAAGNGAFGGVINGKLYVAGGQDPANISPVSTVQVYDPTTNIWTPLAPLPSARSGGGSAVINGILYAVGGAVSVNFTAVPVNTLESYNPATNTWIELAPMPTARYSLGVGAVGGILYAVGGFDGRNVLDIVEAYNPATNTWTQMSAMPAATSNPGVGAINDVLYVVGGGGPSQPIATVQAFTPPILNPANVTLTSSAHPAFVDESILFSAVVAGQGPIPTGSVTFKEDTTVLGTVPLVNGRTSVTTIFPNINPRLTSQTFTIVASYLGDQNYQAADSKPLKQVVNLSKTSTALVSNLNPSIYGQQITLTATVTNSKPLPPKFVPPIPTGTVRFLGGGKLLGSGSLSKGMTTITISTPSAGNLSITAVYGGDAAHIASTSPGLKLVVKKAASATTIASSVNPSKAEQTVTFTARVTSSTTTPVGEVEIHGWQHDLGNCNVNKRYDDLQHCYAGCRSSPHHCNI
jgi:N-acetylneuraminic acid mutarotase